MVLPKSMRDGAAAPSMDDWRTAVLTRMRKGARFGGVYASDRDGSAELTALLTTPTGVDCLRAVVEPGADGGLRYPSLAADLPAAFWYERALHDLSGVVPLNHPRLDPLLLPMPEGREHPRPGYVTQPHRIPAEDRGGPIDVTGHVFTLPFGPVRSGVMESIELLLETPGEDIPHLNLRPHYKHRGIAKEFERCEPHRGVLVAERVEGISSVAHALAYSHAVEAIGDVEVPRRAALLRVVYAELERIVNHLDVTMRLCDAAGLAVATSRFGWHKETVMRLVSRMCGNRFGRGVVVPGGVSADPVPSASEIAAGVARLHGLVHSDIQALENSASFLDRLRSTGPLGHRLAREHGALGPIGRASGFDDDDRTRRTYDGYRELVAPPPPSFDTEDAMARARVRWHEVGTSCELIRAALDRMETCSALLRVPVHAETGFGIGWAEAAQGEALYGVELASGAIRRCFARSASFHNLVLFHDVFQGDIFTDLPFIEASFGLSYAGVAM